MDSRNYSNIADATTFAVPTISTPLLDNFNRPDEGPPPSDAWISPLPGWLINGSEWYWIKVVGNQCVPNPAAQAGGGLWATPFGVDQQVYASIVSVPYVGISLLARVQDANDYFNGASYQLYANNWGLDLYHNNPYAFLGHWASYNYFHVGDRFGLSCIGDSIRAFIDSGSGWFEAISVTNSLNMNPGYIGADLRKAMDNFGGGEVT